MDPALLHDLAVALFFFNDTATTEIYTLSLHDALPISPAVGWAAHAGFLCHVEEAAMAFVVEKMIATDSGDENVGQAVIVIIADGDAHPVKTYLETGTGGNVWKMPVAVIVVKRHGGRLFAFRHMARPIGGIDEQQILAARVVVVEKSPATAHRLVQQLIAIS